MAIRATLCYIVKDGKVLFIRKKRGIGQGKLNGPGGKIEMNEDLIESVKREVKEEVGVDVIDPRALGEIDFYFGDRFEWKVYIFKSDEFTGVEKETDEAKPIWFDVGQIPFHEMWPDDRYWLPLLLGNKKFKGVFHYDGKAENLLRHELKEL